MSSTRLPGKVMMDICGKPMIHRVWDACGGPWQRVVLTSTDPSDDPLCAYMKTWGIFYMRGSITNVLSRYMDAIAAYGPKRVVRVCGDAPFMDSKWIALALAEPYPVIVNDALHAGSVSDWRHAQRDESPENQEHAGFPAFERFATKVSLVPPDYFSVNTQEDLDEARRRWTSRAF